MRACYNGHLNIVKVLIDNGADVNDKSKVSDLLINNILKENNRCLVQNGRNILMTQACTFCHNLDIVKLLIHHGAHINDKDYVSL